MTDPTKHIPGPWTILDTSIISKQESIVIAHMSIGVRMRANAHLIKATPKLLEALEKIVQLDGVDTHGCLDEWSEAEAFHSCRFIAKEAIALIHPPATGD